MFDTETENKIQKAADEWAILVADAGICSSAAAAAKDFAREAGIGVDFADKEQFAAFCHIVRAFEKAYRMRVYENAMNH